MEIRKTKTFRKLYSRRIVAGSLLEKRFQQRVTQFLADRTDPILHDHSLVGQESGLRAFSITGDMRVVYYELVLGVFVFVDIGSHNQVYGK